MNGSPARLIALSALCLTTTTAAFAQPATPTEEHILGRYGYGHDGWSLKRLRDKGRWGYLLEQLDPTSIPDPVIRRALQEPELDALTMSLPDLKATFKNGPNAVRRPGQAFRQLQAMHLLRMISSRRQVQALMTEFWFNHFNVQNQGGIRSLNLIPYLERTIKNHVFGKFEDLVIAVARSPAMLNYLDNAKNFKQGFKRGKTTYDINENYARELMELHTLGVDDQGGVYTQQDVIELARALTGWTTAGPADKDGFQFLAAGHDTGAKTIIGLKLPAGRGYKDGVEAIRYLCRRPRAASYIARKMVVFLVGPGQPDLVKRARQKFIDTGGDLKRVTRLILNSPELRKARDVKVKRPTLFAASALRAVRADLGTGADRQKALRQVYQLTAAAGLPILEVPPPTGWADGNRTFISAGTMLERINRLEHLLGGANPVLKTRFNPARKSAGATADAIGNFVLGKGALTKQTRDALIQYWSSSKQPLGVRGRNAMVLLLSGRAFARY